MAIHSFISEEVIEEFVAECRDHLNATEQDLLSMESREGSPDAEMINRLFRSMHSIKGAAATFGFNAIMELSHAVENVLLLFRNGRCSPDQGKVNALLDGVDKLRLMIEDIDAGDTIPFHDELKRLTAILEDASEGKQSAIPPPIRCVASPPDECSAGLPPIPNPSRIRLEIPGSEGLGKMTFYTNREGIASALDEGNRIYALWVREGKDLRDKKRSLRDITERLNDRGKIVDSNMEPAAEPDFPGESIHHLLFSTRLDLDSTSAVADIPDAQVRCPDRIFLRRILSGESAPEEFPTDEDGEDKGSPSLVSSPSEKPFSPEIDTVRVNVGLLDILMNLAGELVLGRNHLRRLLSELIESSPEVGAATQAVELVTSRMQERIMQMRMQPLDHILGRLRRLVRDLAGKLGKEVAFVVKGGEVEIDKSVLERIVDPLIHIIRNCVDHGIESPIERTAAGKPSKGRIRLTAHHEGGRINVTVEDDGRGIDGTKLAELAVACGNITADEVRRLSRQEQILLIFTPGLSTASTVTGISGRGVGMDIVKTNIEKLGGHIDVSSTPGRGSVFDIRLPLTLAIVPSLIIRAGDQRFAVPQINLQELVYIFAEDVGERIETVGDATVLRLRERLLPLLRLADVLGLERKFVDSSTGRAIQDRRRNIADRRNDEPEPVSNSERRREEQRGRRRKRQSDIYIAVLRVGSNVFGLIVDELYDIEEIVVKPLADHVRSSACFSGATILGDGRVAMILDAPGIASFARLRFNDLSAEERRRQEEKKRRKPKGGADRSVILFNNAPDECFAVPLEAISRLERMDRKAVERFGRCEYVNFRGKGLPLVRLERFIGAGPPTEDQGEFIVIIPKPINGFSMGIVASKIIDNVVTNAPIDENAVRRRGIRGSTVIDDQIAMFLDIEELFNMLQEDCLH